MIPVATEAKPAVIALFVIALITTFYSTTALMASAWVAFMVTVLLFRDLPRQIPSLPLGCVCPVDGIVADVGPVHDPFLDRDALNIRVRQNLWGEFNTHCPIEGKVIRRWFPSKGAVGEPVSAWFAFWIQTDERDDVIVAFDLATFPRFSQCPVQPGERVGQGERCGFIGFGRPVDIYLPATARSEVRCGQRLLAGSDIIGTLRRA